jgi:hypothetical protein
MIPDYSVRGDMFKRFNRSGMFSDSRGGKEQSSIFGNSIPQAYSKPDQRSSACCVVANGGILPAGGFNMNGFYSTIWKRNLSNILITNMAFGENCCNI